MFTNDLIRIWSRCVRTAKVISIHDTCWATYGRPNQKTTPWQEVHKFYPFQPLFLAYWEFQKYQTKVAKFATRLGGPTAECFQLQGGGSPPWPADQGLCPWTPLGALPLDPRYRLALRTRHESYSRLLSTSLFSTWRRPCLHAICNAWIDEEARIVSVIGTVFNVVVLLQPLASFAFCHSIPSLPG